MNVTTAEGAPEIKNRLNCYPEYKDSGVEWLGEVPAGWAVKRLKYAAHINMGQSPSSEDCNQKEIGTPFLQGNAEFGYHHPTPHLWCECANKHANHHDILLSVRAPVGELNLADQVYGIGRGLCAITPTNIDQNYLWYGLQVFREELSSRSTGSTYDAVTVNDVRNLSVLIPPDEQRAIAAFLDCKTAHIDALIEKKRRLISLLEEKRTALISHAVTKGLDPNAPMKDSGIPSVGQIPSHWKTRWNKRVFEEIDERSPSGREELLTVSHITGVTPRSEKNVSMFMAESMEGYKICRKNDLVINTMWAWMGALGITQYDGIVSPSYNVYRLKKEYFPPYLDFLYRTSAYVCEITRHSKGIWKSRLRLYPDSFSEIFTLEPPLSEQRQISEYISHTIIKNNIFIDKLNKSLEKLQEYRTALISAAVTGKIDVRAEEIGGGMA